MNTILFLCTGNYYRSRFAEEYFNHYAEREQIKWSADSKGIQRDFSGNGNVGPISRHTLAVLAKLNIPPKAHTRMPLRVETHDFSRFNRVVAVSLSEHKPMLEQHWGAELANAIEYFDVEDLHLEGHETALPRLIHHLDKLIKTLGAQ